MGKNAGSLHPKCAEAAAKAGGIDAGAGTARQPCGRGGPSEMK